jgi:hypothetical protein
MSFRSFGSALGQPLLNLEIPWGPPVAAVAVSLAAVDTMTEWNVSIEKTQKLRSVHTDLQLAGIMRRIDPTGAPPSSSS